MVKSIFCILSILLVYQSTYSQFEYPPKSLLTEGKMENGKRTGEWKFYKSYTTFDEEIVGFDPMTGQMQTEKKNIMEHKDLFIIGYYVLGMENGDWVILGEKGEKGGGTFNNGIREGKWTIYKPFPAEKPYFESHCEVEDSEACLYSVEGTYSKGYKIGEWFYRNESGKVLVKVNYPENSSSYPEVVKPNHNSLTIDETGFWKKGWDLPLNVTSYINDEIEYYEYVNGFENGSHYKVSAVGDTIARGEYVNGLKNGIWRYVWREVVGGEEYIDSSSGEPQIDQKNGLEYVNSSEGMYINDKREGEWKLFLFGKKQTEIYKDGVLLEH